MNDFVMAEPFCPLHQEPVDVNFERNEVRGESRRGGAYLAAVLC